MTKTLVRHAVEIAEVPVYRLLGCEVTYHTGGLPQPGDTIEYEISVDGHIKVGDVRIMQFHSTGRIAGRPILSMRNAQAGFFSDEELENAGGVVWDPSRDTPCPSPRLDQVRGGCASRPPI